MKYKSLQFIILTFLLLVISNSCFRYTKKRDFIPKVTFSFEDFYPDGGFGEDSTEITSIPEKVLKAELTKVKKELKGRLAHFGLVLSEQEEIEIAKWYYYYETRGKDRLARALTRGAPYLQIISDIVKSHGLPDDLKYLPIVESGFNLQAVSRRKATGPWQFMSFTARKYGLKVDWWIDERIDPIYSTHAACLYLRDLYGIFGRWDLAIAAYNAGEGKIYSRLVRTNGEKFWDIRKEVKRETRNYVPSFLALILFINDNQNWVDSILSSVPSFTYDSVVVPAQANIKQLASWAQISEFEFRNLNPSFIRFATPPYLRNYWVRVPVGKKETFLQNMKNTPQEEWFRAETHIVRKGETLSLIAKKYSVTVEALRQANNYIDPKKLKPGMVLVIPYSPTYISHKKTAAVSSRESYQKHQTSNNLKKDPKSQTQGVIRYRVQRGDTLYSISRRFGVKVEDIKKWNNLSSSYIRAGEVIVIYVD
ncbi:MAG: LysM peptidoglycan-binding domain-containing protein [candidate division WOR-3 bacterium]